MKIIQQPINYNNSTNTKTNHNQQKQISYFALPEQQKDTVTFSAKKKDLLEKSATEIFKILDKSIIPKNMIGYGGLADVYSIPNTQYYVRLLRNGLEEGFFHKKYTSYRTKPNKNLTTLDKLNHVVLRLGDSTTIMQKVEGIPIVGNLLSKDDIRENAKIISKLPLKAYENLLKEIIAAYQENILFDSHPSNIILNREKKTLTPIDYIENKLHIPLEPVNSLFYSLVPNNIDAKIRNKITNKILKATLKEIKTSTNSSLNFEEYDFNQFFESYKSHYDIDYFRKGREFLQLEKNIANLTDLKFSLTNQPNCNTEFNKLWEIIYKQIDKVFRA